MAGLGDASVDADGAAAQGDPTGGGIRDRFRNQIRYEVKQVGLRQLAQGGPQALSVNAIAKELGVSGPALYRYFASRDALLTELVADAYHDLAEALAAAAAGPARLGPAERVRDLATAYRNWANAEPHRYRLLFAAPIPGYDPQSEVLVSASQAAMNVLLNVLTQVPSSRQKPVGRAKTPSRTATVESGRRTLDRQLELWARNRGAANTDPGVALRAILAWTRLHGLVSLEIEGTFVSMGIDPEPLYDAEVSAILNLPT
jgi:AcrR family transcriptional regulator